MFNRDRPKVMAALPELIRPLADLVDENGMLSGDDLASRKPGWFIDKLRADAVLRPTATEQVAAILTYCNEHAIGVVPQGGMTGLVRATETEAGNIVLSLERMNRIEHIDIVGRTARVEAGVILQALQEKLAGCDLAFPLDLGARGSCQLGGNASTNAGGLRVVRYGMMRDLVLGIEAVLADGTVVSSMNEMLKNNTGYDLKQLFIGSEGTLGIITRLVLRLYEAPKSRSTALVGVSRFEQVTGLLKHMDSALAGQLSAFEVMWNSFYAFNTRFLGDAPLGTNYPWYAVVESLGGSPVRDQAQFEAALESALEAGLVDDAIVAKSDADAKRLWRVRESIESMMGRPVFVYDVSLPIVRMEAYIRELEKRLPRELPGCEYGTFGHLADGNLHVVVLLDRNQQGGGLAELHVVSDRAVYEPLAAIGGSVSAEHGVGLEKKPYLPLSRSPAELALMKRLKQLLDPNGILNPGKIF